MDIASNIKIQNNYHIPVSYISHYKKTQQGNAVTQQTTGTNIVRFRLLLDCSQQKHSYCVQ